MVIIITGGAGFIGSAMIRFLIANTNHQVVNIDSLNYAANLDSISEVSSSPRYVFENVDIQNRESIDDILATYTPDVLMHLAAESHVDRSLSGPEAFIQTNIVGTYTLLESALAYWRSLNNDKKSIFRFQHISTDEVYGDLQLDAPAFTEQTPYSPSSPYSASKAASDHLVRAWYRSYGLPVVVTNCSNNYGPYQFPEKLIPHMVLNAIHGRQLPIYGDGQQIRDWLYVEDHVEALIAVMQYGSIGETYNIGGNNEVSNLKVVETICGYLEELVPDRKPDGVEYYRDLINFVEDRPGHDVRYAINTEKIKHELGWEPITTFEAGLHKTVKWYLDNQEWWRRVLSGAYKLERIGL